MKYKNLISYYLMQKILGFQDTNGRIEELKASAESGWSPGNALSESNFNFLNGWKIVI